MDNFTLSLQILLISDKTLRHAILQDEQEKYTVLAGKKSECKH